MAPKKVATENFKELDGNADTVARRLLGCLIEREVDGQIIQLRIVETEAYDQTDAASHSYNGRTPRIETMFGPAGRAYVYFTYGMHYCCNIVVGAPGYGAAVLVRALEPLGDTAALELRRKGKSGVDLTNGPAKLCQALGINLDLNGHDLSQLPFRLVLQPQLESAVITTTTRIGITRAKDAMWRFYITDNPYVSIKAHQVK
jgi:DNA-3-methyladenine glycosylase